MKNLKIRLADCFGIKNLDAEISFSMGPLALIYAPNGSMKSSLAATFQCIVDATEPKDRVNKDLKPSWRILADDVPLKADNVFVIVPMNQEFKSDRISTLLINKKLKAEYESIRQTLDLKMGALISGLREHSGLTKKEVELEFAEHFANDSRKFFEALLRVPPSVNDKAKSGLGEVRYKSIFNDKVLPLVESAGFQSRLLDYMGHYNALLSKSRFFKRGVFNHDNAETIAKNLKSNGFFDAEHSIRMKAKSGGESEEINNEKDLISLIQKERDKILKDEKLSTAFDSLNDRFTKNTEAREFRRLLETNKALIAELSNLPALKDKLWSDYLIDCFDSYRSLVDEYKAAKTRIDDILKSAREEKTKWLTVIDEFNRRFTVPFTVRIENQEDAVVRDVAPSLKFEHTGQSVEEGELWTILSTGERRALYLLNILFEVHARKEAKEKTLFIVDDIADSFDYKNKYAIIEYLSDISAEPEFRQIVMSHNFDFYRSMGSRLNVNASQKFHVSKSARGVSLVADSYPKDPFDTWKRNLSRDEILIASIPFVRNLADYCGDADAKKQLTHLLHERPETKVLTVGDLQRIYKTVLRDQENLTLAEPGRIVRTVTIELAEKIARETEEVVELEKKIVLSIAIRLRAESFMIEKIADAPFVQSITRFQTRALFERFKIDHSKETGDLQVLEEVLLMTPENIHLNSFMYEPIIDMSNEHLKRLHERVRALR